MKVRLVLIHDKTTNGCDPARLAIPDTAKIVHKDVDWTFIPNPGERFTLTNGTVEALYIMDQRVAEYNEVTGDERVMAWATKVTGEC